MVKHFNYHTAFSRNLGWVTEQEQENLRNKCVAIAGLGGVGGSHLLTLTRLGIGAFHIADLDTFEQENFNRQAGANLSTINREKIDVLAEMALAINPELKIEYFNKGIDPDNTEEFLSGTDLYLDGLDFFAVDARRNIFETCGSMKIPAVTAAPLGMGAAVLNFIPGGMTFEEYFQLQGHPQKEQLIRFLVGLSPAFLQRSYLTDTASVNFESHKGPSTAMACDLCAGIAATQVLKILLGRGKIIRAPKAIQFDAYKNRLVTTWRPFGNRNPLQILSRYIVKKTLSRRT